MFTNDMHERSTGAASPPAGPTVEAARVAALDVGSNSFHLMVVERQVNGDVVVLERAKERVRLGESTLRDGVIPYETFRRGILALRKLAGTANSHRVSTVLAVGTSALREASNAWEFVEAARAEAGLHIQVIDGLEEARLIYRGARRALALEGRKVALFDVGGGSTEAILGDDEGCAFTGSLRLGVLRLRDHWPCSAPLSYGQRKAMSDWSRTVLTPTVSRMRRFGFDFLALSSGTALALARLAGEALPAVAGATRFRLTTAAVARWEEKLVNASTEERVALGVDPGRADTIVPGVIIVRSILELAGVEQALVCDAALREGLVAEYWDRRRGR
jgi:exopolyphosphatase/guanosine-5'-triphosphate,3'-diphosphate pyrophosphatase